MDKGEPDKWCIYVSFPLGFLLLQNTVALALSQRPTFAWMEEHALKYPRCLPPHVCKYLHEQNIYCLVISIITSVAWTPCPVLSCSCSANYEGSRCEQYQLFSFVRDSEEKGMIAAVVIIALLIIAVLAAVIYYVCKWVTWAFDAFSTCFCDINTFVLNVSQIIKELYTLQGKSI